MSQRPSWESLQTPGSQPQALRAATLAAELVKARAALAPLYEQHAAETARRRRRWQEERE